jgi:hypothetical protein
MKTAKAQPRPRRASRKPKPIVYGVAWGRLIKRNAERDLRSGVLRVNAEGEATH